MVRLLSIGRFTLIGILAASVHISIAWVLIAQAIFTPLPANIIAFLLAFMVSFSGHYYWTFGARSDIFQSLRRFLIIAVCAMIINNLILVFLLQYKLIPAVLSVVIAACIIPVVTYILSHFWAFK